ncbi:MAG: DegT/DnrJ/EryC1/StrS family aminotransferase [Patescibacteria group bacterium]
MKKVCIGVGCLTLTEKAEQNIKQVLETGRLSYGPFIQEFERRFSKDHGCAFGVMVNSGTSALQIAVACLAETGKWKTGDEVIVPAVTFVASSNVVIQQGFKPVFVDVDSRTYNIDPSKIEEAITKRTKAIMVVHLFGQPADMDPIMKIARKYKLKVIEDSCETMYAKYKGKSVGSFGDIGCFSTYVAHLIVTGVGGIAVTNNKKYATVLRSLANHGRDGIYISIDDDKKKKGRALEQIVAKRFRFIRNGYSYRVTELEGALGCAQLDIADQIFAKRKKHALYMLDRLADLETHLQLPIQEDDRDHSFMMFPIVVKRGSGIKKMHLVHYLEHRGIETRDMLPLINQPFYRKAFNIRQQDYPVAHWINTHGFYVGCHQEMDTEHEGGSHLDIVCDTLLEYIERYGN